MAKKPTAAQEIRTIIIATLEMQHNDTRGRKFFNDDMSANPVVVERINALFAKHQEPVEIESAKLGFRGIDESKQLVLFMTSARGKKPMSIVIK